MRVLTATLAAVLLLTAAASAQSSDNAQYVGPTELAVPSTVFGIKTTLALSHVRWVREGDTGLARQAACPDDPAYAGARCFRLADAPLGPVMVNAMMRGDVLQQPVRVTSLDGPDIAEVHPNVSPRASRQSCRLVRGISVLAYRRATLEMTATATVLRDGRRVRVDSDQARVRASTGDPRVRATVRLRIPRTAGRVRVRYTYRVTAGDSVRTGRATYVLRPSRPSCFVQHA